MIYDTEAERLTDGQPEYLQAGTPVAPPPVIPQQIGPAIPPPDGTGLSITDTGTGIGGTGGLIAGPGDVNANPVTGYTPYQQYPILMSGAVPNYYAPGMESAYDVGRLPTLGNFYLRPNTGPVAQDSREDFPSFFQATAPQDYNVLDWSEFSPQWNKIIDYVDAVRSGSPDAIENTRNEFIAGDYTALLKPLGIADSKDTSKNDAIALALSRYYAGQPVPSNYSTRAVANVLSSIYDNKQNEYLRKEPMAGSNMTTHFIGFLETVNPDRFGRN